MSAVSLPNSKNNQRRLSALKSVGVFMLLVICFGLTLFGVQAAHANVDVTLQDGVSGYAGTRDADISSFHTDSNFGSNDNIRDSSSYKGLIRFAIVDSDGGPIPAGATINSATLSLYKYSYYDHTYGLRRVLRSWDEASVTWNSASTGQAWSQAGASGTGTDVADTLDAQASTGWNPGWIAFDVTATVQDIVNGGTHHGWKLDPLGGNSNLKRFYTREYAVDPTLRPKLVINYTQGGGPNPPTVAITVPTNNASFDLGENIAITAAVDNDPDASVTGVDFYANGTLVGHSGTAPYSVVWSGASVGTHTLMARVLDPVDGAVDSANVTVDVVEPPPNPPTVVLSAPSEGQSFDLGTDITLSATVGNDPNTTVTGVEFYAGGVLLGQSTTAPYTFSWSGATAGTHTLMARVLDPVDGAVDSSPVTITIVDPPTVVLSAPSQGQSFDLGTDITLSATVGNDPNTSVTGVEFYADGSLLGQSTTAPYTFSWSGATVGTHTLMARVLDPTDGAVYSVPVTIDVVNTTGGGGDVTLQDGLAGYAGTQDTDLSSYHVNLNFGSNDNLRDNNSYKGLIRFAIVDSEGGPVPAGSTITSASLSLYKYSYYDHTYGLRPILRDWNESQVTWNEVSSGVAWTGAGATGIGTDVADTLDAQASTGWNPGWIAFDVTAAVQAIADGSANYGWKLESLGGNTNLKRFYSSEYAGDPTLRPKLTVVYSQPSPPNPTDPVEPTERITTYDYYPDGLLKSIDGPRADTDVADITTFQYSSGNRTSMTNAKGHVTQYTEHDGAGRLKRMVDPNGLVTAYDYHPRGWLLSQTIEGDATVATTDFGYDAAGNMTRIDLPTGGHLIFNYDAANRLDEIVNDRGEKVVYTLDAMGNRTREETRDAVGNVTREIGRKYNNLNRMDEFTGSVDGRLETFEYDANGNLKLVQEYLKPLDQAAAGDIRNTSHDYDALDRLEWTQDPILGEIVYKYDKRDNLISVTDQEGLTTTYEYNAFDDLKKLVSPDTGVTRYWYDAAGNLIQKTDARNVVVQYAYDELNRLTDVSYPNSSLDVALTYDVGLYGKGRLTTMTDGSGTTDYTYDQRGNLRTETYTRAGSPSTTEYIYDSAGQLDTLVYPSGIKVHFDYDGLGDTIAVSLERSGAVVETIAHSIERMPFGPISQIIFGNGLTLTQTYDLDYRLDTQQISGVLNTDYDFNKVDNITRWTDSDDLSRTQTFFYDDLDRLEDADGPYGVFNYTYDGVGNRLSVTQDGDTQLYVYDPTSLSHRLYAIQGSMADSFNYDDAGNLLGNQSAVFDYDDTNRLVGYSMTGVNATYAYNGRGERVEKNVDGVITRFRYSQGQLIGEYDAAGTPIREYVYLDGQPIAMLVGASGTLYYLHTDHLGSVAKVTDGGGVVVWDADQLPFGKREERVANLDMPLRFPGQYYDDESGLHYNYFRDYDPSTGRYIQSDPIGLAGGVNTYAYALGNPLANTDPLGLFVPAAIPAFCIANPAACAAAAGALGAAASNAWQNTNGGGISWPPKRPRKTTATCEVPSSPPPSAPKKPDCEIVYNLCMARCVGNGGFAKKVSCWTICTPVYLACKYGGGD